MDGDDDTRPALHSAAKAFLTVDFVSARPAVKVELRPEFAAALEIAKERANHVPLTGGTCPPLHTHLYTPLRASGAPPSPLFRGGGAFCPIGALRGVAARWGRPSHTTFPSPITRAHTAGTTRGSRRPGAGVGGDISGRLAPGISQGYRPLGGSGQQDRGTSLSHRSRRNIGLPTC